MLDFDLAALYEVPTKVFNQAVKRNLKRFPKDFMFQLSREEWHATKDNMISQSIQNQTVGTNRSQIVTSSQKHRASTSLPFAFTEQGVAMLSGILTSEKAIAMNIAIMRAFVEVRRVILMQSDLKEQLRILKERISEHDIQLSQIYDSIEHLLDEHATKRKWEERERIGFRKT
jgi:hypothetical protein